MVLPSFVPAGNGFIEPVRERGHPAGEVVQSLAHGGVVPSSRGTTIGYQHNVTVWAPVRNPTSQQLTKQRRCGETNGLRGNSGGGRQPLATMADHSSLAQLAGVIDQLLTVRREVDRLEYLVVSLLRANGVPWEAIGDELGISRQAARSRFSMPRTRQRP